MTTQLPDNIDIPAAWYGPEMAAHPERWQWTLTSEEVTELERAAQTFLSGESDLTRLTPANFPLPTLKHRLAKMREGLIRGIGFELVHGLPVSSMSEELASTIFCGFGAHLGSSRSQNAKGDLLGHVRDIGANSRDPNTRIYQTSERQTFHTDSADVVGLLCLNEAREGGDSLLVSAVTMYNEFRERRPDILPLLFDEIATDRRGEVPAGEKPFFTIPVYSWHEGSLTVIYQRQYIDSAQRFPDAPRLTPRHVEALDLFDELANDPALNFTMRLKPGDMQFVYNHSMLHDRTAFVDHAEPERRRHLLRLWLSIPGDRPLPPSFRQRYGSIEIGNRGGIIVKKELAAQSPG